MRLRLTNGISRIRQRGVAVLLLVVTLILGAAAVFYGLTTATSPEIERDRKTAEALATAKAALIGYATGVAIDDSVSVARLGDLPCPDRDDSGTPSPNFGSVTCNVQTGRIGRLPWKTLGLPDLRDGDGERLWYAVSTNFKNDTRTDCTASAPEATTCLNSETRGTITIRDPAGNIKYDATNTDPANSGVIAVIFSPGAVLRRQGTLQNRSCVGGAGCNLAGLCLGATTPKCDPINYLDIDPSSTEDNGDFTDSNTNGFINGIIRDASGNVVVNDRLIVITYQDLMPQLEKRVTGEISKCLVGYANANFGRYPWAAPLTAIITPFKDGIGAWFGRVPDLPLWRTKFADVPVAEPPVSSVDMAFDFACTAEPNKCMTSQWPSASGCNLPTDPTQNSWWNNWKLQIFYAVADAYKPQIVYTQPMPPTVQLGTIPVPPSCPACLTVNPPNATADKQFVVIAAGRRLPGISGGQPRTSPLNLRTAVNYLEGENNNSDSIFTKQSASTTFNDAVVFFPP